MAKADTYLALGVIELWLLNAEAKSIEIRNVGTAEGRPEWKSRRYGVGDVAVSIVLDGWQVSVAGLFADL